MTLAELVVAALTYGLSGGLSPGSTNALILSESLQHGRGAGIRVAISPLLTDAPIVLLAWWVSDSFDQARPALIGVSLLGAAVLVWLAIGCFRVGPRDLSAAAPTEGGRGAIWRGMVANFINPHPWLFWLTIGAPTLREALPRVGTATLPIFLGVLYTGLVGTKIVFACVAGSGGSRLGGAPYVWTMRAMGLLLLGFAARFLGEAMSLIRG